MHIWPECLNGADKAYLEKTWASFPSIAEMLAFKLCDLYEEALSSRSLLPGSLRIAATEAVAHGIGNYPLSDYEKIIRRLKKTFEKLIDAVELEIGLEGVDLVEARFEIGHLSDIEKYSVSFVEKNHVERAFSIAERAEEHGKKGNSIIISMVEAGASIEERTQCNDALKEVFTTLEANAYEWANPRGNYWNNDIPQLSVVNHLGALSSGYYGDSDQAVYFVRSMIRSLTHGNKRVPILTILSSVDTDARAKIIFDAYRRVSASEYYNEVVSQIDPVALFSGNEVDVPKGSLKVFRMLRGNELPEWYTAVLAQTAVDLYRKSDSICNYWHALYFSAGNLEELNIPKSFSDYYTEFLSIIDNKIAINMSENSYLKWDYADSKIIFSGSEIGKTLLEIVEAALPGVASETKKSKNNDKALMSQIREGQAALFLTTAGLLLRKCGLISKLVDVLAKTPREDFRIARLMAECLDVSSKEMARNPLLRETSLSADLGL